jgi:uncharacterized protein
MANHVVHVELIGPEPAVLRAFYGELFGWDAPPGAPVADAISATDQYAFLEAPDGAEPVAGGIGGGPGFAAHAVFYVGVDDVAATLDRVESLGGRRVLGPVVNAGGAVVVGHFRDPAGNLVGVAGPR